MANEYIGVDKIEEHRKILEGWNEYWKEYKGIELTEAEIAIFKKTPFVTPEERTDYRFTEGRVH